MKKKIFPDDVLISIEMSSVEKLFRFVCVNEIGIVNIGAKNIQAPYLYIPDNHSGIRMKHGIACIFSTLDRSWRPIHNHKIKKFPCEAIPRCHRFQGVEKASCPYDIIVEWCNGSRIFR